MGYIDERPPKRLTLKGIIAGSGITQRALAEAIGRHEVVLSQIISGRTVPTRMECFRIAGALGHHPRSLFGSLYDWEDWSHYAKQCGIDYEVPPMEMRRTK